MLFALVTQCRASYLFENNICSVDADCTLGWDIDKGWCWFDGVGLSVCMTAGGEDKWCRDNKHCEEQHLCANIEKGRGHCVSLSGGNYTNECAGGKEGSNHPCEKNDENGYPFEGQKCTDDSECYLETIAPKGFCGPFKACVSGGGDGAMCRTNDHCDDGFFCTPIDESRTVHVCEKEDNASGYIYEGKICEENSECYHETKGPKGWCSRDGKCVTGGGENMLCPSDQYCDEGHFCNPVDKDLVEQRCKKNPESGYVYEGKFCSSDKECSTKDNPKTWCQEGRCVAGGEEHMLCRNDEDCNAGLYCNPQQVTDQLLDRCNKVISDTYKWEGKTCGLDLVQGVDKECRGCPSWAIGDACKHEYAWCDTSGTSNRCVRGGEENMVCRDHSDCKGDFYCHDDNGRYKRCRRRRKQHEDGCIDFKKAPDFAQNPLCETNLLCKTYVVEKQPLRCIISGCTVQHKKTKCIAPCHDQYFRNRRLEFITDSEEVCTCADGTSDCPCCHPDNCSVLEVPTLGPSLEDASFECYCSNGQGKDCECCRAYESPDHCTSGVDATTGEPICECAWPTLDQCRCCDDFFEEYHQKQTDQPRSKSLFASLVALLVRALAFLRTIFDRNDGTRL